MLQHVLTNIGRNKNMDYHGVKELLKMKGEQGGGEIVLTKKLRSMWSKAVVGEGEP